MDLIGMTGRSNFFEERVSMYQRADVLNEDRTATSASTADADGASADASGSNTGLVLFDPDF
jgi:hypothetical protein